MGRRPSPKGKGLKKTKENSALLSYPYSEPFGRRSHFYWIRGKWETSRLIKVVEILISANCFVPA
jgi:hypothetical protein